MPARQRHVSTLLIFGTLTLLATVAVAPVRNSGFVTAPTRSICLQVPVDLAINPLHESINAAAETAAVAQDDSLSLGEEEQDQTEPRDEPGIAWLVPSSLQNMPGRPPTALRSTQSHYPLRC